MSTSTERSHRHRQRRRDGRMCVRIEIDLDEIDDLVATGWLKEWNASNPVAIASAIENRNQECRFGATRCICHGPSFAKNKHDDSSDQYASRDRLLRSLGGVFAGTPDERARACWVELTCYRDRAWRKGDRAAPSNPHAADTVDGIAWEILKINPHVPSVETVFDAIRGQD